MRIIASLSAILWFGLGVLVFSVGTITTSLTIVPCFNNDQQCDYFRTSIFEQLLFEQVPRMPALRLLDLTGVTLLLLSVLIFYVALRMFSFSLDRQKLIIIPQSLSLSILIAFLTFVLLTTVATRVGRWFDYVEGGCVIETAQDPVATCGDVPNRERVINFYQTQLNQAYPVMLVWSALLFGVSVILYITPVSPPRRIEGKRLIVDADACDICGVHFGQNQPLTCSFCQRYYQFSAQIEKPIDVGDISQPTSNRDGRLVPVQMQMTIERLSSLLPLNITSFVIKMELPEGIQYKMVSPSTRWQGQERREGRRSRVLTIEATEALANSQQFTLDVALAINPNAVRMPWIRKTVLLTVDAYANQSPISKQAVVPLELERKARPIERILVGILPNQSLGERQ